MSWNNYVEAVYYHLRWKVECALHENPPFAIQIDNMHIDVLDNDLYVEASVTAHWELKLKELSKAYRVAEDMMYVLENMPEKGRVRLR